MFICHDINNDFVGFEDTAEAAYKKMLDGVTGNGDTPSAPEKCDWYVGQEVTMKLVSSLMPKPAKKAPARKPAR